MPRQARLDVSGALHHIMVRGINKSTIFEDDQDRIRFLEQLGQTVNKGNERILGTGDFVQTILKEAEESQLRQLKLKRSGRTIADIIREECKKGKISSEELKRGNRRRSVCDTRLTIARRSRAELGLSGADIARHLGVNTSSINRALSRGDVIK